MKTLIFGFGKSGKAAEAFLKKNTSDLLTIYEDKSGKNLSEEEIKSFDRIILSPGVPLKHPIVLFAQKEKIPLLSEIELVLDRIRNHTCIGISGSNGKTTLTLLLTHLIESSNKKARAVGNVGTPISGIIDQIEKDEILVFELSSYQIDLLKKPFLDAALLTNICPNHLDRYENYQDYIHSKLRIKNLLKPNGSFFVSKQVKENFLKSEDAFIYDTNPLFLKKPFLSPLTIIPALVLCDFLDLDHKVCMKNIKQFQKPKHRLEFVAEINGISFYNDSKATNAEAVLFALNHFEKNVILIAGGEDKHLSYCSWQKPFKEKVKRVFVMGKIASKIKEELKEVDVDIVPSMEEAVFRAFLFAKEDDIVLLSPGSSSLDMFKNYEERGELFTRCVQRLKN